jgi:pimeloyl-ACP methyl ester carboxylesterase
LSGPTFSWCIDSPDNPSGEILWFFHGAFQNEKAWHDFEKTAAVRGEWQKLRAEEPTVISISYGSFWLLSDEAGGYDYFIQKILPFLEDKAGGVRGRRMLMGFSMGGFNAAQIIFREGGRLFQNAVLVSPAFLTAGPYANPGELEAYYKRHAAYINRFKVNIYIDLLRGEYTTPARWAAHDPLQLVERGLPEGMALYVSDGDVDNYGFQEGAGVFAKTAAARGAKVTWNLLSGGHKTMDPAAIARFLLPNQ